MRPLGHNDDNVSVPRRARASALSAVVLVVGAVAIALTLVATTADGGSAGRPPADSGSSTESTASQSDAASAESPSPEDTTGRESTGADVDVGDNSNVSVQVANSTRVDGAAGKVTDSLKTQGYITLTPTNATGGALLSTKIHHAAGFLLEARSLAEFLNLDPEGSVFKMPSDPGENVTNYGDPKILILVGADLAN